MSSYLSNLLTTTTSRYNSLRRTLLSNEDDGDSEDDSHISRVLRAYYSEKGRPFPPWLPPDPNDRRAVTPQPVYAQQKNGYLTSAGGRSSYPNASNAPSSRGGLNDLWDAPAQPTAPMQPQSLRAGWRPAQSTSQPSTLAPPAQARPLPSQRAGSYQSVQSQRLGYEPSPPGSSAGGGTAQERLKARLWGGSRSNTPQATPSGGSSPALSSVGALNPYGQPSANAPWAGGGGNPYDRGGQGDGGGGRYQKYG